MSEILKIESYRWIRSKNLHESLAAEGIAKDIRRLALSDELREDGK